MNKKLFVLLVLGAASARAQTMLDQQQRLIQIHSLLIGLEPGTAPAAYRPGELSLGLELIVIPPIDGQTGGKTQITASDRTPVFPRPRFAIGLPAPDDYRGYLGATYLPPFQINGVSSHQIGLEVGYARAPETERLSIGLRGHALYAESKSPVTDPATRDTLASFVTGLDLSAAWRLEAEQGSLTPFVGAGFAYVSGHFRVTSDNELLTSNTLNPAVNAGLRLYSKLGIEALAELVVYPGVLIHPVFIIAWTPDWFSKHKS